MTTYIAIYMGIGLAVAAYRLYCQRKVQDIKVNDLLLEVVCCSLMWPLAVVYGVCSLVVDRFGYVEKLLNEVVIKKRK